MRHALAARRRCRWRILLLLPTLIEAPIPCDVGLYVTLEVEGLEADVYISKPLVTGEYDYRDCSVVNPDYEGSLELFCWEGEVNGTSDACQPKSCPAYLAISVTLPTVTSGIMPTASMPHGSQEERRCFEINELYRKSFILKCTFGKLSVNTTECFSQWEPMPAVPWLARSRASIAMLAAGDVVLMGGVADKGPLREVWQWTPTSEDEGYGTWKELLPPPWSARFGMALVVQNTEIDGEQVTIIGGHDGQDRNDVWRWLAGSQTFFIPMEDGMAVGTQKGDCSYNQYNGEPLLCAATRGVIGRRWTITPYLLQAPAVHIRLRHDPGPSIQKDDTGNYRNGKAAIVLTIDECRLVFEVVDYIWYWSNCIDSDVGPRPLGAEFAAKPFEYQDVSIEFDRGAGVVNFKADGNVLVPAGAPSGVSFTSWEPVCTTSTVVVDDGENETSTLVTSCSEPPPYDLRFIELAVWPTSQLIVEKLAVTSPPGCWQALVDEAPFPPRSSHAAVNLPDGDILVVGGLSNGIQLNDVWRWTPTRCVYLQGISPFVAARSELECNIPCEDSWPNGQWRRLPDAPFAPRHGHTMMWTQAGLLLVGGVSTTGIMGDVWRWTYEDTRCTTGWRGSWFQITAAAPWPTRYGHGMIGFPPPDDPEGYPETILLIGGFGGEPPPDTVQREEREYPREERNDVWCGSSMLTSYEEWYRISPSAPFSERTQSSIVSAPMIGEYAFMHMGGYDKNSRHTRDFYRWTGDPVTRYCETE